MKNKILEMLKLQDKMNSVVNPDWHNAGYKWTDAIMVEGVEAIEHYGWKWWKKQEPNLVQSKMELVDIWHFALSLAIEKSGLGIEDLATEMERGISEFNSKVDVKLYKETFVDFMREVVGEATVGSFQVGAFLLAMASIDMSFDELYKQYIAKNCLNIFRQDHGYKTGTYIKDWSEIGYGEDNDCLVDIMNTDTRQSGVSEFDFLYQKLEEAYSKL